MWARASHQHPFGLALLQSLQPYYERFCPRAPLRYSGTCGVRRLRRFLRIGTTGSPVPIEPDPCSCRLYARRRWGTKQAHRWSPHLIPQPSFRGEFAAHLALNPTAGVVIRESGGLRKIRWVRDGSGKSGGVRIIYFNRADQGDVVLLTMFAKGNTGNIPTAKLKEIRRALEK